MKRRAPDMVTDALGVTYKVVRAGTIFSAALLEEWQLHDGKPRKYMQDRTAINIPLGLYTLLRPRAEARVAAWRAGGKRKAGAK